MAAWRASLSSTTKPAAPLSYIPATVVVAETVPSIGIGPCRWIDCSACTSMAGSYSPSEMPARPPCPTTVAKVGSTRWVTPWEFSVVRSSSNPTGSSEPAPTPRA